MTNESIGRRLDELIKEQKRTNEKLDGLWTTGVGISALLVATLIWTIAGG